MHRLLLIESSPTLRRGMERLLRSHGFEVAAVAADQAAQHRLDEEIALGLGAVLLGWTDGPEPVCHALARRLSQPDCSQIALLVLASDPARVRLQLAADRPHMRIERMQRPADVPRLLRGLLAQVARQTRTGAQGNGALRVLLVDDSRTSRMHYERLLLSRGYEVLACESAADAIERATAERFDLAIVDYYMPLVNGAMLCRTLRELPETREVALAILTGSYEDGLISDCLEAGALECMFKNESSELFLARVQGMARLRERELRLKEESERLELILGSVGDGVYGVDRSGRITFANPAALRLLQCAHEDELVGLSAHDRLHPADERGRPIPAEICFLQQAYELGDSLSNWDTVFWRGDGTPMSVECTVRPQHRGGDCVGVVVAFRDIADRKHFDAEMQWQLHHDHLTQLHNRRHFEGALEEEIARLRRSTEQSALLFIDLDRFKNVNDTGGHAAGDALLALIGRKLKSRSRQSDVVARLGGDEFVVLLRNVDDGKVLSLAETFRAILDDACFIHAGREYEVSGSVGICPLNRHTLSPAYAMNCADAACQIAKRQGRNRFHRFDLDGDTGALASLQQSWSTRLTQALSEGHFSLEFQPMLDLRRLRPGALAGDEWLRRLCGPNAPMPYGYEVFLRLDELDMRLAPNAFLTQAERFELLPEIDTWVLERMAALMTERQPRSGTCFHINVAMVSLQNERYRQRLAELMRASVFAPGQLCLEIKESEALAQLSALRPALTELAALGIGLVLDDFGRGFGGLDSLRSLPLSAVKLDGALVQALTQDQRGATLVRAMTDLAHTMNLLVIAPLVEDASTLRMLQTVGADCAQGFVLGRPGDAWAAFSHAMSEATGVPLSTASAVPLA